MATPTPTVVSSVALREALVTTELTADAFPVNGGATAPDSVGARPMHRRRRQVSMLAWVAAVVAVAGLVGAFWRIVATGPSGHGVVVADSFDKRDSQTSLGTSDSGQAWLAANGVWGIQDHAARIAQFTRGKVAFAVLDTGSSDGTVAVTQSVVVPGAGLVFRYRDPANYWAIEAAPRYGTWAIQKVVGGKRVTAANTGLSSQLAGTTVIVRFKGSAIDVFVNGVRRKTLVDTDFLDATRSGLIATNPTGVEARWTAFRAAPSVEAVGTSTTRRKP